MKISPISGNTPITPQSNTGLAPEKLARLKAIAAGETVGDGTEIHQDPKPTFPKPPSIKLKTNHTTNRDDIAPEVLQESTEETAIPDANVQTNAPDEATQPLSPQQVQLAKERRRLQLKEKEIAEREQRLIGPTRAELEARLKTNALSTLQELGVTYDQLTNEILAQQATANPEIESLKADIQALKEGVDKTLSEKDAAAEQAVLAQMQRNVDHLSADGDDFEQIRVQGRQADVVELIHRIWKKTGEVLDETEAMQLVEEDLVNEALKIAQTKKVQAKLTPPAPLQQQPQNTLRTLTNKDQATPPMNRRQRAIAAMLGQKR